MVQNTTIDREELTIYKRSDTLRMCTSTCTYVHPRILVLGTYVHGFTKEGTEEEACT